MIGERGVMEEMEEVGIDVEVGVYDSVWCMGRDWEEMEEWLDSENDVGAVVVGSDFAFMFVKLVYVLL